MKNRLALLSALLFVLILVGGLLFANSQYFSEPYKYTTKSGARLNEDILLGAEQIYVIPEGGLFCIVDEDMRQYEYDTKIYYFDESLNLIDKSEFYASRIIDADKKGVIVKRGELVSVESIKHVNNHPRVGPFEIKYFIQQNSGGGRWKDKLLDSIKVNSQDVTLTLYYRRAPEEKYFFVEQSDLAKANNVLTIQDSLIIPLEEFFYDPDWDQYYWLARDDSIIVQEELVPADSSVSKKYSHRLLQAILNEFPHVVI